jgi:hypothetical protein
MSDDIWRFWRAVLQLQSGTDSYGKANMPQAKSGKHVSVYRRKFINIIYVKQSYCETIRLV